MQRCYLVALLSVSILSIMTSEAWSQNRGDDQFYSEWRRQPGSQNQWTAIYFYKENPNARSYKMQRVVWRPDRPGEIFYYNAKNKYWCIAPTDPALRDIWNVLPPNANVDRMSQVGPSEFDDESPPIPGTKDTKFERPMLSPNLRGLPIPREAETRI